MYNIISISSRVALRQQSNQYEDRLYRIRLVIVRGNDFNKHFLINIYLNKTGNKKGSITHYRIHGNNNNISWRCQQSEIRVWFECIWKTQR